MSIESMDAFILSWGKSANGGPRKSRALRLWNWRKHEDSKAARSSVYKLISCIEHGKEPYPMSTWRTYWAYGLLDRFTGLPKDGTWVVSYDEWAMAIMCRKRRVEALWQKLLLTNRSWAKFFRLLSFVIRNARAIDVLEEYCEVSIST